MEVKTELEAGSPAWPPTERLVPGPGCQSRWTPAIARQAVSCPGGTRARERAGLPRSTQPAARSHFPAGLAFLRGPLGPGPERGRKGGPLARLAHH